MKGLLALVMLLIGADLLAQAAATTPRASGAPITVLSDQTHLAIPDDALRIAAVLPQDGDARFELAFWESIKDSEEPADYEAYLKAFPDGRFAPLARARAKHYRERQAQQAPAQRVQVEAMDAEYVALRTSNLRENPNAESRRLEVLEAGTRLQVTGRVVGENWYRVKTPQGGSGYIFGNLIEPAPAPKPAPPPQPKTPAVVKQAPPGSKPVTRRTLEEFADCADCPRMIALPAGSFTMGSNSSHHTERPEHRVTINRPFAIGKYEVTVSQWNACVLSGGCTFRPETSGRPDSAPVHNLSWNDAQQYVAWLSSTTGETYRLPTEAEWEYAARGNTRTPYWWGNSIGSGNADCKNCGGNWDQNNPSQAGSFPPNPFGLHDTSGGVWEWVSDCWHRSYDGAPRDGGAWEDANCRQRVLRGGSWRNDATYMVSSTRFNYDADVRYLAHGLRVAKTLK